jgi:hypothetical protein
MWVGLEAAILVRYAFQYTFQISVSLYVSWRDFFIWIRFINLYITFNTTFDPIYLIYTSDQSNDIHEASCRWLGHFKWKQSMELLRGKWVAVGHAAWPVLDLLGWIKKVFAESLQLWTIPSSDSPRVILLKANVESTSYTPE